MEQHLEQIREQQRASWNKFSPGWKKWDTLMMSFMRPTGDEIIQRLHLKPTDVVLDVASGTGEPGLTIAEKLTAGGRVVSIDIAEDMLAVARENAARRGLRNFETQVADVCELPFPDASFDAISCRFGFMFFPDMQLAANEMARVLRPGGRLATAVWAGPEQNFWVTASMGIINQHLQLPPPPPGAPGMFRCAQPDFIANMFRQAGLQHVAEIPVPTALPAGSAAGYWEIMTDVAAPVAGALSQATPEQRAAIERDIMTLMQQRYPSGEVTIPAGTLVIAGEK
ncbi:class I SAM-dependent methyltransferase [Hymenobacter properus]|uniref:Methyltransferase domain-containing protein n=1 Tax=Hymenobacter properus TaxID=2791026 RepID=A0A931BPW0_9BACT|nr:methyltransferase domain-containing protein [Hymenobacter properus]MBF9144318.1 methyltransferase domain-containing protein [Hymenobacter properus]MBR7723136.1 methyltransferase domain-containing protein [Microvirga sp. SRT04]